MQAAAQLSAGDWRGHAPAFLAGSAAATAMVSIAASQILLGLAIVALLASGTRLRWPPVSLPLAVFFGWTLLSFMASGHMREGLPQIKKFYVFLILFVVYSAIENLRQVRWMALACIGLATISSLWSLEQFARKYAQARAAHVDFYTFYIPSRVSGFMSHWMTFSGEMMMALMLALSLVLFARPKDRPGAVILLGSGLLIGVGLLAAETRSMWGGAAAGALFLLWRRSRWLVLLLPVLAGGLYAVNLFEIRERISSMLAPHEVDSNEHRALLRRVGAEMIKAHPVLGLGPEQVGKQFDGYVPADVPRPIPSSYYTGHLHNIYYQYAAERGLPALLALLWLLGRALYDFFRALGKVGRDAPSSWILHAAVACTLAVMAGGFYEVNLGDSEVLAVFLSMLACGYLAVDQAQRTVR
jgi:putative inorganic carbon (HCO3(-)) transporter